MKARNWIVVFLFVGVAAYLYAGIGASDLSSDAKKGWAWRLTRDHTQNYSVWEPALKVKLEEMGIEYNVIRINVDTLRAQKIHDIRENLRFMRAGQIDSLLTIIKRN